MGQRLIPLHFLVVWLPAALGLVAVSCLEASDDGLSRGGGEGCEYCHAGIDQSGAHARHVHGAGELRAEFACTECHPVTDQSFLTADGDLVHETFGVGFSSGEVSGLGDGASYDADEKKCNNVYCHGASLPSGEHTDPKWEGDGELEDHIRCQDCHGLPPDDSFHASIDDDESCRECHEKTFVSEDDMEDSSGHSAVDLVPEYHINGVVDFATEDKSARMGEP